MVDPEKQAAFIAGLRKKAEELAAKNPAIADMRMVGKALLIEARKRAVDGNQNTSLGAYLMQGTVTLIEPEENEPIQAEAEILSKLKVLAEGGNVQAIALCKVVERQVPGGRVEQFVSVHAEHATGQAIISQLPVDEAVLMQGVPGASGPAVGLFGGPANPKIFQSGNPNVPILKIALMVDGRMTVDGMPATMESLRSSLRLLAERKGSFGITASRAERQAPPQSLEITKAVIENRLSIRLSSRADYSDAISLKAPTE